MLHRAAPPGRRALLRAMMAAPLFAAGGAASARVGAGAAYPPDVGSKFFPDGRVHPFAGNTVICHLDQQGERSGAFNALLDLYRQTPSLPFHRKVAWLPPSSYHMTIAGGANDRPRRVETWPSDLPLDLPLQACHQALGSRLRAFRLDCELPLRMRVDPSQSPRPERALTLQLAPADDVEGIKLARLRQRLGEVMKLGAASTSYQFHISLGYPVAWFSAVEAAALTITWSRWIEAVRSAAPVIELGAPEFCIFNDMFAFQRQFYLA